MKHTQWLMLAACLWIGFAHGAQNEEEALAAELAHLLAATEEGSDQHGFDGYGYDEYAHTEYDHAEDASEADYDDIAESIGVLQAALQQTYDRNSVFLARHDIDITVGGRVRQEGFHFDSPLTFRSDYGDRYTFQRSKYNFDVNSTYGKRQYGSPAVESKIRVTAFNVWDNYDVYSPIVLEPVAFNGKNYIKKAEIGEHHHDSTVTLAYLEDGFMKVHFDKLADTNVKSSLQVGYFPYSAGRGIALGDYFGGAIDYLGWAEKDDVGNTTQRSPGVLFSLGDPKSFSTEVYYSKWKKRSHGPDFTREGTHAKRLDRDDFNTDPKYIQRGYGADRDLFAAKVKYHHTPTPDRDFSLYVEPYGVYVNAPELEVEFEGDASAKLFTMGCMAEWKRGNWAINVEVGAQMGHQQMHAIDRNHVIVDDAYYTQSATAYGDSVGETDLLFTLGPVVYPAVSTSSGRLDKTIGTPAKYHSHMLVGITSTVDGSGAPKVETSEMLPYRAYYLSDDTRHINSDRGVAQQGQLAHKAEPTKKHEKSDVTYIAGDVYQQRRHESTVSPKNSLYSPYTFESGIERYDTLFGLTGTRPSGALVNANIPFAGGKRFRDAYKMQLRGFMAMCDVTYTFPSKNLTVSAAIGHVSGDDNPFNKETDKSYNGFIPLRDANYEGRAVKSYGVLAARKIARPSTFSDQMMYAPNNYESISNLQYVGVGSRWHPIKKDRTFMIESNALYFWEDRAPFKWDKDGSRDFGDSKINGIWQKAIDDLNFTGWQTNERASSKLGLELNTVISWRPIKNLETRLLLATFVPGQLYKDVDGTPNAYAVRLDQDGDLRFDSLGHQVPFGGMFRLTYWF